MADEKWRDECVPDQRQAAFQAVSTKGKVPTLVRDDGRLTAVRVTGIGTRSRRPQGVWVFRVADGERVVSVSLIGDDQAGDDDNGDDGGDGNGEEPGGDGPEGDAPDGDTAGGDGAGPDGN